MNNILTIIRGLPGSGKSTLAKSMNVFHLENDYFSMENGKYIWTPEKKKKGEEMSLKMCEMVLKNGNDVVVCNVFYDISSFIKYIELSEKLGVKYRVIKMESQYNSIHNVPKEHFDNMVNNWENFEGEKIMK